MESNKKKVKKTREKIYYLDDENNVVSEAEATHAVIRETDADGNLVNETYLMKTDK